MPKPIAVFLFKISLFIMVVIATNVLQAGGRPTFHKNVLPKIKLSFYKQNDPTEVRSGLVLACCYEKGDAK